jgi:hypothetical protein
MRVSISRPNTVGVTRTEEFEYSADACAWIHGRLGHWADLGWECGPAEGDARSGSFELTHDDVADVIVIAWEET